MTKFVLGLTGAFGSGCTKIANDFIRPLGFEYISLSNILRTEFIAQGGREEQITNREVMQDFGNRYRQENSTNVLALKAKELIEKSGSNFIVIDSIRNPNEIEEFRNSFVDFFLIGIFASKSIRWERVKDIYKNNLAEFERDEDRDQGEYDIDFGQRVTECFLNSDLVISNNDNYEGKNDTYKLLNERIKNYIDLLQKPYTRIPSDIETLMAIAYANSQRSSCLKRKVGAIIVDKFGNIISSGYNEVPSTEKFCIDRHDGCYRDKERERMKNDLIASNGLTDETAKSIIKKIKVLEKCRSLHAEENAILNIARFGSSVIHGSRLYTTTYPCNLCANKIAQMQIKEVIYFEPYPIEDAKKILDKAQVNQVPFEGITFKSYFKVFGKIQM